MIRQCAAYVAERFSPAIFVPALAVHVALALWVADVSPTLARLVQAGGMAALLLLQFRLWDDLEDRERDRVSHPDRVLVRAAPTPFRWVLAALGLTNLVVFAAAPSGVAFAGIIALDAGFLAAYRLRARLTDHVWRFRVLLLKYPAFVGLVATAIGVPRPGPLALAMGAMYAAACGFEVFHNRHQTIGAML